MTVDFAGNHRSAWKDARYRDALRTLAALPGVKRIGLGYVRQAAHGKPAGGVRILRAEQGSVLVHCYSNEGFCEARLYGEDVPRIAACAAALPNALATAEVESEEEPVASGPAGADAVAGLIRAAVAESLAHLTDTAVQAVLQGGVEAAVRGAVAEAMGGVLARVEDLIRRLERAADDAAGAVHVACDLEQRLNEILLWHAPAARSAGEAAGDAPSAAADPALAGNERMSIPDYIRVRGYKRPPSSIVSALGMRMRRGAEASGFVYSGTTKKAFKHPVLYLRRMDAEIRTACDIGCEPRATLGTWLTGRGIPAGVEIKRLVGQRLKALALEQGVAFLPWESSRSATEFPTSFLDGRADLVKAMVEEAAASVARRRAEMPKAEASPPRPRADAAAGAAMPETAPETPSSSGMRLKAFLESHDVGPLSAPAMRKLGRDIRRVAMREGHVYDDLPGPAVHPVRILEAFLRPAKRLEAEERAKADAEATAAASRRPTLVRAPSAPPRSRPPVRSSKESDEDWPWRQPGFAQVR